jgi:hypothetical protein
MTQAIQRDIQHQRYIPSPTSTSTIVPVRLPRLDVGSAFCRMHMLDKGMQKKHFTSGRTSVSFPLKKKTEYLQT